MRIGRFNESTLCYLFSLYENWTIQPVKIMLLFFHYMGTGRFNPSKLYCIMNFDAISQFSRKIAKIILQTFTKFTCDYFSTKITYSKSNLTLKSHDSFCLKTTLSIRDVQET